MRTKVMEILNHNISNFSSLSDQQLIAAFNELVNCMIDMDEDEALLMDKLGYEMSQRGLI